MGHFLLEAYWTLYIIICEILNILSLLGKKNWSSKNFRKRGMLSVLNHSFIDTTVKHMSKKFEVKILF